MTKGRDSGDIVSSQRMARRSPLGHARYVGSETSVAPFDPPFSRRAGCVAPRAPRRGAQRFGWSRQPGDRIGSYADAAVMARARSRGEPSRRPTTSTVAGCSPRSPLLSSSARTVVGSPAPRGARRPPLLDARDAWDGTSKPRRREAAAALTEGPVEGLDTETASRGMTAAPKEGREAGRLRGHRSGPGALRPRCSAAARVTLRPLGVRSRKPIWIRYGS